MWRGGLSLLLWMIPMTCWADGLFWYDSDTLKLEGYQISDRPMDETDRVAVLKGQPTTRRVVHLTEVPRLLEGSEYIITPTGEVSTQPVAPPEPTEHEIPLEDIVGGVLGGALAQFAGKGYTILARKKKEEKV